MATEPQTPGIEPYTGRKEIRQELGFKKGTFTAPDRAGTAQKNIKDNTGVDTELTPEMQRSEYFTRMADRLNNRQYWRPGHFFAAAGMPVQGQAGTAYQRPELQIEDQREHLISRARQGDKLKYQELARVEAADQVFNKALEGEVLNQNDIEKVRMLGNEQLRMRLNLNEAELYNAMREIRANKAHLQMIQTLSAQMTMSIQQTTAVLAAMSAGGKGAWLAAALLGGSFGIDIPDMKDIGVGEIGTWLLNAVNEAGGAKSTVSATPIDTGKNF